MLPGWEASVGGEGRGELLHMSRPGSCALAFAEGRDLQLASDASASASAAGTVVSAIISSKDFPPEPRRPGSQSERARPQGRPVGEMRSGACYRTAPILDPASNQAKPEMNPGPVEIVAAARGRRRLARARSFAAVVLVLLSAVSALAQDPTTEWTPPAPTASGWDWALLDTGEWIKGELIVVFKEEVIFDSDKFGEQTIDWEDIVALRLALPRIFRRLGGRTYAGMGEVDDGMVRILTATGTRVEFPQTEIVGVVYANESELRNWRMKLGASLAARAGNTDQQDLTANVNLERDTSFTRWKTSYVGTFSRVEDDRTVNNHRAVTQFDWLVTHRFFVRIPGFEFFADEFQNIDWRLTPGGSVGYELIDTRWVTYQVTTGAAAQITEFDGGDRSNQAAVLATSELSLDLPRDIDLELDYRLTLVVTDLGKTSHNTSAVMSFEIWDPIELDVGAFWDRIESPERRDGGDRPKKNDFRMTVGLSIDF